LNEYFIGNNTAFQHIKIHRLSVFAFKMLNFTTAPKIRKEYIVDNFLASSIIKLSQKDALFLPYNFK